MITQAARSWWVHAVRGAAAVIFGIAALVWPGPALEVLVYTCGAIAFIDGVANLASLARGGRLARRHAWATGISGILGIGLAIVTLMWPGITAMTMLYVVALWAISTGVLEIVAAMELRRVIDGEGWIIGGGVLSIVFGSLLVIYPGSGLVSMVWLVGFYAILSGFSSLRVSHRLHRLNRRVKDAAEAHPSARVA